MGMILVHILQLVSFYLIHTVMLINNSNELNEYWIEMQIRVMIMEISKGIYLGS